MNRPSKVKQLGSVALTVGVASLVVLAFRCTPVADDTARTPAASHTHKPGESSCWVCKVSAKLHRPATKEQIKRWIDQAKGER